MTEHRRRGKNVQPLEIQALLKACITYRIEDLRQQKKPVGHLYSGIQQEMCKYGEFPLRPLFYLHCDYKKTQREYRRGKRPYPPEARELWGPLEGETEDEAIENDAAWKALTEAKLRKKASCTHLSKSELSEVIRFALEEDTESLPEKQKKAAFETILGKLNAINMFVGRKAGELQKAYIRMRGRFQRTNNADEFPESASKLWGEASKVLPEVIEDDGDFEAAPSPPDVKEDVEAEEIESENVCSICQAIAYEVKHLFRDIYQNQTYAEIINQTLNVKMLWNGQSSAFICQLCSTYIEGLSIFHQQCQESCTKLNVILVTKEEPQLQDSTFWESASGAGTPPRDDEANSPGFQANDFATDSFDEQLFDVVLAKPQLESPQPMNEDVGEETRPVEDTAEPEKVLTEEEQNYLKYKQSRPLEYRAWKRKPLQCELCGKTVLDIKSHLNSHLKIRSVACDLCPKTFTNRNQMLCHRNTHTRERTYPCSYCNVVYDSWKGKNYHEKMHIAEMNNISYNCDQCDATFKVEKNLNLHVKFKHLRLRKLQCTICEFATINKTRLVNHVRSLHSEERPFRCPFCKFTSNSNTGYFIHFKRHKKSGEAKEYCIQCAYCSSEFLKDAAFERHILEAHEDRAIKV